MDDLPFHGQTFLVATSEDLVEKVARAIREKGGHAIPFPTIRLVPPKDYVDLDRGLRLWRTLDWVVFTSAHGVEAVVEPPKGPRLCLFPEKSEGAARGLRPGRDPRH